MITPSKYRKDVPIVRLLDVVQFKDNLRKPITANERIEGPYPYYGANGIQGYINDFIFDEELVLLAEDGGHFYNPDRGIAYKITGKTWVNNHAHVLKANEKIDINYLTKALENLDVSTYINGTTRAKLTKANAEQIQIPLPPLAEQKRIAAILDKADEIKRKREQAIAKLDQLAQSIFVEMFGDIAINEKGWEIVELSNHVSKLGSGSTPTGGDAAYKANGISLIRSLNVHDGVFKLKSLAFIDDIQASKLSNVEVKDGDVLLNITGASVARVCRVPSLILPARVNQHVMIIRLDKTINNIFFEKLLVDKQMKSKLLTIAGSGATREAITKAQMQELKIIFPPLALQEQFATRISKLEKLKASNIAALEKHNQLFASLQNQAFTGQL